MYTADEVFEESLRHFRERQPSEVFAKFLGTTLKNVQNHILATQSYQERMKTMVGWRRMSAFIAAFHDFETAAGLTDEQAACIWGPVKYILQTVKEDVVPLDDILQSYRDLGSKVPSMEPYKELLREKPDVRKCLAYMYQDLLEFQNGLLRLFSGHNWKGTFHINWKDFQEPVTDILKSFDHHKKTLEEFLRNYDHQRSNDMNRRFNHYLQNYQDDRQGLQVHMRQQEDALEVHIRQYEEDREVLLRNAETQEKSRKEQQLDAVRKWISVPPELQHSLHRKFAKIRDKYPDTTEWVVRDAKIQSWMCTDTPEQSILWINGKKGAGKTILASQIIDLCKESQPGYKTSYFYCRENDPNQDNCLAIYKSLLNQMLSHHPEMLPSCNDKRLKGNNDTLGDTGAAELLIHRFCDANFKQFIIIDGLDEMESRQRKSLVNFLTDMVEKCDGYQPGKVRLLFISHDLADIRKMKRMETAAILELDPEITTDSIKKFINVKIEKLKRKLNPTPEDIERVKTLTITRSNGMFLFASLVMKNLLKQPSLWYLQEQLKANNFPKDLREAYDSVIKRLRRDLVENQWLMAKQIFGWLACAKRPLNWHEIQAALSIVVDRQSSRVEIDYRHHELRDDVRKICGSLVHKLNNRIVFAHQTVRDHIINSEQLDEKSIECSLTITCLSYLASPWFQRDLEDNKREEYAKNGYFSLQDYAASKWDHHLKAFIHTGAELFRESPEGSNYQARISRALANFAHVYREDLASPEDGGRVVTAREQCRAYSGYELYDDLITIWTHLCGQQRNDPKQRNKVSIQSLDAALRLNRTKLEKLVGGQDAPAGLVEELRRRYGDCMFKCDRLLCDYFYEGFKGEEARETHLKRHDRPYRCPIEDCSVVIFGFSTNKDREKHVRWYHPDDVGASGFIQMPRELVGDARFNCPECGQTFTRKANRDAHVRSHFGERPFECSACDKAFTRVNDLRRHEKTKHVRRRA